MKVSSNINPELLEILTPYTDWFFSQTDHDKLREPDRRRQFDIDTGTSEKYMNEMVVGPRDQPHTGNTSRQILSNSTEARRARMLARLQRKLGEKSRK